MFRYLLLGAILNLANSQCDYGWKYFEQTHSCFKYFYNSGNWFAQDQFCHKMQAHLAKLTTAEETDFVKDIILSDSPTNSYNMPWLGLMAPRKDCVFRWLDGSPLNTSAVDFMPGQPSECRGEELYAHPSFPISFWAKNGRKILNDIRPGTVFHRTLCKKPATPNHIPVKKPCDEGWTFYNETKSCFMNFFRHANWAEAQEHCESFGAIGAKIITPGETMFLRDFVTKEPVRSFWDMPWTGLSTPGRNCQFVWKDYTPLDTSAVTFTAKKNQPDNCRTTQFCGAFYSPEYWDDGINVLDDLHCHYRLLRVLCKKSAVLEPVPEPVVCKKGWSRLNKTNTCIKDSHVTRQTRRGSLERHMEKKCEAVPMRSYFDRLSLTCFVKSSDCYSVPYPGNPSRNTKHDNLRRTLQVKGVMTGYSLPCVFGPDNQCGRGEELIGENCFWVTEKDDTWSSASNECQKKDGSLFVPHNDNDMQRAFAFVSITMVESSSVWIGLILTDEWRAIDGTEIDYLRWRPVVSDELSSTVLGSKFFYNTTSKTEGSFAAYTYPEKSNSKLFGLCSRKATGIYLTPL